MITTDQSWCTVIGEAVADDWWDDYRSQTKNENGDLVEDMWSSKDEQGNNIICDAIGSHALLIFLNTLLALLTAFGRTKYIDEMAFVNHMAVADVVKELAEDNIFQEACDCIEELLRKETTYTAIIMPTHYQEAMQEELQNLDQRYEYLFAEFQRVPLSAADRYHNVCAFPERVLFIGTQFSILYTFMYSPA